MMQTMKRGLAWLLVLIMLAAFVPTLILTASAAEVTYVYDGKYIYNWGTRGTVATFLSPNAEEFYEDNDTSYAELSLTIILFQLMNLSTVFLLMPHFFLKPLLHLRQ